MRYYCFMSISQYTKYYEQGLGVVMMGKQLQMDLMVRGVKKKKIAIILGRTKSIQVLAVAQMARHLHKDRKTKGALNVLMRYH